MKEGGSQDKGLGVEVGVGGGEKAVADQQKDEPELLK